LFLSKEKLMLNRPSARLFLFLLFLGSPALLRAQFQPPTDDELKMTEDPKAPGADAVYLNIEQIEDDEIHYESYYARIKVLSERGKELATVGIPYLHGDFSVSEIKARTIHSDGTVIPLAGKPEDLLVLRTTAKGGENTQFNRKVFTLPSVEVGSILEYRYVIHYDDNRYSSPTWEVQRQFYVHKAHFAFTPFRAFQRGSQSQTSTELLDSHQRIVNSLIWWPKLPPGAAVKTDVLGRFSLDVTDIPAAPDEEWMPPDESYLYKVVFYYKAGRNANDFWITDAKLWSKDLDRFANPSKAIRDAANGLVAPGDSELDKAKKLYAAVQALDNTDFSRHKSEVELKELSFKPAIRAEDTWAQKSGSSEEISLLYLAMLRAAGLNGRAMKVVDRRRGQFDIAYLSLGQLNDTLVVLNTGGKDIVLDPGEKMCPFGTVHWRHSGAGGIIQDAGDHIITSSPPQAYPDNKVTRIGDITIDAQGAMTGSFRYAMTGQQALEWRQRALETDLDEVKKQFDHLLLSMVPEGVEAQIDRFTGLDDPSVSLVAFVNLHGNLGATTGSRMMLPGFFFQTRGGHPFVAQPTRSEPVDMHYGEIITDQVTYHLPAGFTVEGAPADAKISWPDHAIFIDKIVSGTGQIVLVRSSARAFTFAKPDEYQSLRDFYQKIAAADQQQLVLTRAQAVRGN
jgi:hypothetical protein